jgi:hypothetical protein
MCHCCCEHPWHAGYRPVWGGPPWARWGEAPRGPAGRPQRKEWLEAYKKDLETQLAEVEDELAGRRA